MAFFDQFKRNATDVANKAAKKTNELTGIAKLQINIKNKESKLCTVYEEIGRYFYNAERSGLDCTEDIANCIMKADKIKAEIASAKQELARLRKVVICEGCGNEIADTAAFCSFCGMKQIKPEPEVPADEECCCDCEESECCCDEECCCKENNEETTCCCNCSEVKEETTDAE